MRVSARTFLVPFALGAMGCFVLVFQGCERKPAEPAVPSHAPESYMNDSTFMSKLAEARKAQGRLVSERNDIAEKMRAKVDAVRERLKTDDHAKVQAELDKDPEWAALYAQCTNMNAKCAANRKKLLETVRKRIAPPKPTSK